jgi:transposase InsO family protein
MAGVSESGYYQWLRHKDDKANKDTGSVSLVQTIVRKHKHKIGIRRIHMTLRKQGVIMNTKKIARIKREYDLPTMVRKKNPYNIALKKNLEHAVASNLLDRKFEVYLPDKVYSTDITYLPYSGGVAYLSATKDLATREIMAWNINSTMGLETGLSGLKRMLESRALKGLMIHSDQGVHYTHPLYIRLMASHGIVRSMSRKGNALDNAPIESFFGHMKDEIELKVYKSFEELKKAVEEYIKEYNTERSQWDLKKMTPREYRDHLLMPVPPDHA